VRDKLDFAFEDAGEQRVKNIARPLRVYHVRPGQVADEEMNATQAPLPLPDKPSLAVLPFTNMSGDPEQEFVSDGIAEDVITALSRHPSLFVIARNSTFTYKGRAVDVKQVGRELGVRYVLEGSVRKAGNRIRVTAQLIEAGTGNYVWAERYDRDLADIFAVQDEITQALTTALTPAIADAELRRAMRRPPESLDAWAAYQRGLWHLSKANSDDDTVAQNFFRQAIDLDSTFAPGYSALALAQLQAAAVYQKLSLLEAQSSAEALARRAVGLDGADAEARSCLGWALQARGEREGALVEIERALAMSPNLAVAHWQRGATLIFSVKFAPVFVECWRAWLITLPLVGPPSPVRRPWASGSRGQNAVAPGLYQPSIKVKQTIFASACEAKRRRSSNSHSRVAKKLSHIALS